MCSYNKDAWLILADNAYMMVSWAFLINVCNPPNRVKKDHFEIKIFFKI